MTDSRFERIFDRLSSNERNVMEFYEGGQLLRRTFPEIRSDMLRMCSYLRSFGIDAGKRLGIWFENDYSWVMIDLACLALGVVSVPFHSDIRSITVREAIDRFDLAALIDGERIHVPDFAGVHSQDRPNSEEFSRLPVAEFEPWTWENEDVFTIVFTSGSTGFPKAIEMRIKSVTDFLVNAHSMFDFRFDDRMLIFMPFSHFGQRSYIYAATIFGLDTTLVSPADLFAALRKHRPTILVAVPLFFEGVYGACLGTTDADRVRRMLGGSTRLLLTGSAPMRPEVLHFFADCEMIIYEGYGSTETGLIALNHPGAYRLGSVGRPFPNKEVVIEDSGEILVRSDFCWAEKYVGETEEINAAIFRSDGFIRTGDIGAWDDEGYLYIRGRNRDLMVFSNGKKAFPAEIEGCLASTGGITMACVFMQADRVCAVIVADKSRDQDFVAAIRAVNKQLPDYVQIKSIVSCPEPFSVENGLLTASLKFNRACIIDRFVSHLVDLT